MPRYRDSGEYCPSDRGRKVAERVRKAKERHRIGSKEGLWGKLGVESRSQQIPRSLKGDIERVSTAGRFDSFSEWLALHLEMLGEESEQERAVHTYVDPKADKDDLNYIYSGASSPGGQNANKGQSKLLLYHLPTCIRVKAGRKEARGSKEKKAVELLNKRLADLVGKWFGYWNDLKKVHSGEELTAEGLVARVRNRVEEKKGER